LKFATLRIYVGNAIQEVNYVVVTSSFRETCLDYLPC